MILCLTRFACSVFNRMNSRCRYRSNDSFKYFNPIFLGASSKLVFGMLSISLALIEDELPILDAGESLPPGMAVLGWTSLPLVDFFMSLLLPDFATLLLINLLVVALGNEAADFISGIDSCEVAGDLAPNAAVLALDWFALVTGSLLLLPLFPFAF